MLTPDNLFDTQKAAIKWLHDGGNFLCADIGTGKTVISATFAAERSRKRVLVLGPKKVVQDTWPQEFAEWSHLAGLSTATAVGSANERRAALESGAKFTFLNHENITWLCSNYFNDGEFDVLIIDEIDKISRTSGRFKALMKQIHTFDRVIGMTGTPVTEGLHNLWALFRLTNREVFPKTWTGFRDRYFYQADRDGYLWMPKDEKELVEKVRPYVFRLEATYPVTFKARKVPMGAVVSTLHKQIVRHPKVRTKKFMLDVSTAAVSTQKLQQVSSGFVYDDMGTAHWLSANKLTALQDILHEDPNAQYLICYWYECFRDLLDFPNVKDGDAVARWNAGEIRVMTLHPASAGHGLNLQKGGAYKMVFITIPWSAKLFQQAVGRLARLGQKQTVEVTLLIGEGTADERVWQAVQDKRLGEISILKELEDELRVPPLSQEST